MKYFVFGFLGLGLAVLLYNTLGPNMSGPTMMSPGMMAGQGPHSVQQTQGDAGGPLVAVSVPQLSPVAEQGQATFVANCAACHGVNASGQDGVAPPLVHIIYEPNHHGDASFYRAVQQGVRAHHWRFGNMPPVEGVSEQEVASIITYVRELQRANGIN